MITQTTGPLEIFALMGKMVDTYFMYVSLATLRRMVTMRLDTKRKMNCLMNQLAHSTHCFSPIINIDSLIRVSFSRTSSCEEEGEEEISVVGVLVY